MTKTSARDHPDFGDLLDYWLGDSDETTTDALDEHLFGCEACGAQLDRIAALTRGVREAFDAGRLSVVVTPRFVARLAEQGRRMREYRVPLNGSVNCSVGTDDEVVVGRLQVPLEGVQRLDITADASLGGDTEWLRDIPFDAASGEVVLLSKLAELREMPAHEMRVRVLAVEDQGSREIGHFTFRHTPSAAP
ncbi:hypothetical protein [Aromatoleum buckelii]|uniref:Zinc-finger domain-containing protein n=1 Tax=Aromatoleum buckelii TaxID=200254 RepID=A0ABX1N7S6_9RHOO|nr:hypothetical protein [Aromatoleum buckelii]MCK0509735.1 hypothetical protein [Aromatoleum buckelii]